MRASAWLELEGLTTHFANIEDTTDHSFAEHQIDTFTRMERIVADAIGTTASGTSTTTASATAGCPAMTCSISPSSIRWPRSFT